MNVLDRRFELMPRPELEQFQLERLQAVLVRVKRHVRRYREKLGDATVESLADLARLPFTTPGDLAESFPYGLFAFPMREVIRLHSTLGPEGRPVVVGHTRSDLARWGRLAARQLVACGVTASDVIQVCFGGGVYGAAGYLFGAQAVEASVIAEDPSHIDYQVAILQNYRPTILITTPSHALHLARILHRRRIDPPSLQLRTVLLSRPVPDSLRQQLAADLAASVRCNFGLPEILDPGLCIECEAGGFHVQEDQFLPEIHDGELVLTTLCREALPLLRYRTRVACEFIPGRCSCGRTGIRIAPGRRLDGRVQVHETSLYPSQAAEILARSPAAGQPFTFDFSENEIRLSIEMSDALFDDAVGLIEGCRRDIESEFLSRLGVPASVRFVEPRSRPGFQPEPEI
ncbi:MAG: hypothetical protein U1F98_00515 [Verrucomicrobiota bacterium]